MAEFNLHARLDATVTEDVNPIFEPYAEDTEAVTIAETDAIDPVSTPDVVTPPQYLEIEGIEKLAEIYTELNGHEAVAALSLSGPTADRFVLPVAHHALQQIGDPKLYEFHALDGETTLVVSESQTEFNQLRQDVPTAALS